MKCPFCDSLDTKVTNSRLAAEGLQVRRRRECLNCSERFTTYENLEINYPKVIKQDGTLQLFDEQKLRQGIKRALEKRSVTAEQVEELIEIIKIKIRKNGAKQLNTQKIGEIVLAELKHFDEVAYIRFASVYRKFKDIEEFRRELDKL